MNLKKDVLVIIRSAGERTERICKHSILLNHIDRDDIFLIKNITPFSSALREGYKLAIKKNKKYTFFIDADLVLFEGALEIMLFAINHFPKSIFFINPLVYDYLTGYIQPGGPHLYATEYIRKALAFIPNERKSSRPETYTVKKMKEVGLGTIYLDIPVALHNFEQYYRDIFRKVLNKYHRTEGERIYLYRRLNKLKNASKDFEVALLAMKHAKNNRSILQLNYKQFDDIFERYNVKEKDPLRGVKNTYTALIESVMSNKSQFIPNGYTKKLVDLDNASFRFRRGIRDYFKKFIFRMMN